MKKTIFLILLFVGLFIQANAQYLCPAGKATNIFPLASDTLTANTVKSSYFTLGGDNVWLYRAFVADDYVSGTRSYTLTIQESSTPNDANSWVTASPPALTKTGTADDWYQFTDTVPTATSVRFYFDATYTTQKIRPNVWITPVHLIKN